MLENILNRYLKVNFILIEGLNAAVIGVETQSMRLIYSISKTLKILQTDMDLSPMDSVEYFLFTIQTKYSGELAPIWCDDDF